MWINQKKYLYYYITCVYNTYMKREQYYYSEKMVYSLSSYVLWSVKYKRKVLTGDIAHRLKEMIEQACDEIGVGILQMDIKQSYVLLRIEYNPSLSVDCIVKEIKKFTAPRIRKEFTELRSRLPAMWSSYYFASNKAPTEKEIEDYMFTQPTSQRNENDERMVSMYNEDQKRILAAYAERMNKFMESKRNQKVNQNEK